MPRRHRVNIPGGIYHVMSRGNRKGNVFLDDRDRKRFRSILIGALARFTVHCYSGCQMANHYHFVLMTPHANLSVFMKHLNQTYTQYMNRRHGWTGHVFETRPTVILVDTDYYLRTALAYVARNPVEAGFVVDPAKWRWSTYASTIGTAPRAEWLDVDWLDSLFPATSRAGSQEQFRVFVMGSVACDVDIITGAPAIGSPEFRRRVRSHIGAMLYKARLPRSYRALHRPDLNVLFEGVTSKGERASVTQRAHVVHGYKLAEIARFLSLHPNSISRILSDLRRAAEARIGSRE